MRSQTWICNKKDGFPCRVQHECDSEQVFGPSLVLVDSSDISDGSQDSFKAAMAICLTV